MYEDLQHIHNCVFVVKKNDILNQMLLVSVENGLTRNLRFIIAINASVERNTFTKIFPGCGTSLLNLASKHQETFSWLVSKFKFDEMQLEAAYAHEKWYNDVEQYAHHVDRSKSYMSEDDPTFRTESARVINSINSHFDDSDDLSLARNEVLSVIQEFMQALSRVL